MKCTKFILLIVFVTQGCIVQFLPEEGEYSNYIAVDGLITDQNNSYIIKISRSSPLNKKFEKIPLTGCIVTISDDLGNQYLFKDKENGAYVSDSLTFRGITGRKYVLNITTGGHQYKSFQMEMKPVPRIDSLYANVVYKNDHQPGKSVPGFQVYTDTHDPENKCRFYRWDFNETWEFRLPYTYPTIKNVICWKTGNSDKIYIANTSSLTEDRITKFPLNFITTETDRLKVKYSFLLRQYSLNEVEYDYWDKLRRMTENVGGLYDVIPGSIESNIYCTDNPFEKVLGFFSVSSVSAKRIFIKNALPTPFEDSYGFCPSDIVAVGESIPGLGVSVWIISWFATGPESFWYVLTRARGCADCTVNGSNKMPDFWISTKNDAAIQSTLK